jgi:two-component system cell cycle response regulator DivK
MAKILLVEDQEMNRDMLSRRLKKRGYEVAIAVDGAEGVEKARAESPDLILMDMSLPVMDGWEATRILKAEEGTRAIPAGSASPISGKGGARGRLLGSIPGFARPIQTL